MKSKLNLIILFSMFFLISAFTYGQVRLPKLISNGMVLQRDIDVKIWGWASVGENIAVQFMGSKFQTVADNNGEWEVILPEMDAGGPYEMKIDASNSITISEILIGDVWICSGQSNMQYSLRGSSDIYKGEIENSENPNIRHFGVFGRYNIDERQTDFRMGSWQSANPESVLRFTAVGYFFAKKLYDEYKVPIGLISNAVGGSSAEAWISEESIKEFPKYYEEVLRFQTSGYMEKVNKMDDERVETWNNYIIQNDEGFKNQQKNWFDPDIIISDWETIQVPGYWTNTKIGYANGVVWYRKEINIPENMAGEKATLRLGRIFDADSVYINGKYIGFTGSQYSPRTYEVPENLLKAGKNTIAIRVISYIRRGGFVPDRVYEINDEGTTISLEGEWKYRIGVIADQLDENLFTGKIPTGLFKGALAPILNYKIKGALWYQGESNTSRAHEHFDLFKLLIKDWRLNWQQGDFPFLFVQLPNFTEVNIETTQHDWAIFRESQLKALTIPNTGMAVTIDVGQNNDIHPVKKKPVGERLALAAQKFAYGNNQVVYSGPIYKSMEINGNEVTLIFDHVGNGLISKDGKDLSCFEICGTDNNYVPAKTKIVNNKIVVWSNKVINPVAVRYAWSNNPVGINFFNREGLPASPFRTSDLY